MVEYIHAIFLAQRGCNYVRPGTIKLEMASAIKLRCNHVEKETLTNSRQLRRKYSELCSTACSSKTLYNYSLSISSGLHPGFFLCYTNFIIINCYISFMKSRKQRGCTWHYIWISSPAKDNILKLNTVSRKIIYFASNIP